MMRLLSSYFFWSYERGSVQYDVMVTAILLFVFVGPRFIDFKDKPVAIPPIRSSEVLVKSGSDGNFIYEVRAEDLGNAATDAERSVALRRIVESISDTATFESYQPVVDTHGKIIAYDARVRR